MYKTARLANWLKVRPSELWNLRSKLEDDIEEGEDIDTYLLDFDFAIMEFWDYLSSMREQKRKGSIPGNQKLGKNQTWLPKYTDEDILDKFFLRWENQHTLNASLSDSDIHDFLLEWGDDEDK